MQKVIKSKKIDGINVKPQQRIAAKENKSNKMLMRFWKWNSKKRIWKNRKWIWEYDYSRIEADDLSDRIHALLKKQGIGKDDVVLINLKRSARHTTGSRLMWKALCKIVHRAKISPECV